MLEVWGVVFGRFVGRFGGNVWECLFGGRDFERCLDSFGEGC